MWHPSKAGLGDIATSSRREGAPKRIAELEDQNRTRVRGARLEEIRKAYDLTHEQLADNRGTGRPGRVSVSAATLEIVPEPGQSSARP